MTRDEVQCVCQLISSANRHISISTHSWPPCPTLFKQILIVLWKAGPINTVYGVPPRGHLQGQTRNYSNTRFFHIKKEHICMCCYIISVVYIYIYKYMSYHILFEGIYSELSYSTHMWNAYVGGNLLKRKKREKWSMPITKENQVQLFWKDNLTFHELKSTLKIWHFTHRSWQHFKMKFLWRCGRELCCTLECIQTVHAQSDKENCVEFL